MSYETLEVSPKATQQEIQDAYRVLASVWHPDRFTPGSQQWVRANEKLKEINAAYDVLSDPQKRAEYDRMSAQHRPRAEGQSPPPPPFTPKPVVAEKRPARFRIPPQYLAPILITLILLVGQLSAGILLGYGQLLTAIGAAIVTEVVLSRLWYGKWPSLASAYITGISIGILVRSLVWWPYALGSALSITSKYVLRVKGRHLWNPSNFGISTLLFVAPAAVASLSHQWDNRWYAVLLIWVLGGIIVGRLKRLHITLTYVASFVALAVLRSWITGYSLESQIAPITGPMYQLFIFFMITDPKTTVHSRRGQMLVAFLVALVEMIFRLFQNVHAPYFALFTVGPIANLTELWLTSRAKSPDGMKPPMNADERR